jgi:hypothetical protein
MAQHQLYGTIRISVTGFIRHEGYGTYLSYFDSHLAVQLFFLARIFVVSFSLKKTCP